MKKEKLKLTKNSFRTAIKTFSACVGITAVCMLITAGFLYGGNNSKPVALEASLFNGNTGFTQTAADTSILSEASAEAEINKNKNVPKFVIPLGSSFGIKMFTDGLIVSSVSELYTENGMVCPAVDSGIKPGDYILEVNGKEISNNSFLAQAISSSEGKSISLKVKRNEEIFNASVTPVFSDGAFKAGMWVRDSAAGIGTLTFYNPQTGIFAGLGHGICDMDTNSIVALKSGEPAPISICGITKGEINKPGQLRGYFSSDKALGSLIANSETGIYGRLDSPPEGLPLEVADKSEIKCGDAEILVSLDKDGPKIYKVKILEVNPKTQKTKNLVIEITDPRLLELTGGIVQGMSGSPIIQNNKLVGAVTHVFTDNPKTGYGIFASTMVEESVTFSMSN